ncbi:hypothetical protein E2C01_036350 [Portunus trituberculatus]|uniref:Uncharacterized protein n=1 Tax=Portunus trituberculatus TaxID=210409 RepID=A0A5B7F8I1_PORTR|nr:hypothetical protein [Portunus trituberculatus]
MQSFFSPETALAKVMFDCFSLEQPVFMCGDDVYYLKTIQEFLQAEIQGFKLFLDIVPRSDRHTSRSSRGHAPLVVQVRDVMISS